MLAFIMSIGILVPPPAYASEEQSMPQNDEILQEQSVQTDEKPGDGSEELPLEEIPGIEKPDGEQENVEDETPQEEVPVIGDPDSEQDNVQDEVLQEDTVSGQKPEMKPDAGLEQPRTGLKIDYENMIHSVKDPSYPNEPIVLYS